MRDARVSQYLVLLAIGVLMLFSAMSSPVQRAAAAVSAGSMSALSVSTVDSSASVNTIDDPFTVHGDLTVGNHPDRVLVYQADTPQANIVSVEWEVTGSGVPTAFTFLTELDLFGAPVAVYYLVGPFIGVGTVTMVTLAASASQGGVISIYDSKQQAPTVNNQNFVAPAGAGGNIAGGAVTPNDLLVSLLSMKGNPGDGTIDTYCLDVLCADPAIQQYTWLTWPLPGPPPPVLPHNYGFTSPGSSGSAFTYTTGGGGGPGGDITYVILLVEGASRVNPGGWPPPPSITNALPLEVKLIFVNCTQINITDTRPEAANGALWVWFWGDGNLTITNERSAVHTYATQSNYTVILKTQDISGRIDVFAGTIDLRGVYCQILPFAYLLGPYILAILIVSLAVVVLQILFGMKGRSTKWFIAIAVGTFILLVLFILSGWSPTLPDLFNF
jgi:hypothetical protein